MKKKKNELARLKNIVDNSFRVNDDFELILLQDLSKLLNEYFEIIGDVEIKYEKINCKTNVQINFIVSYIKNFIKIPKQ